MAVAKRSRRIGADETVVVNSFVISGSRDNSHGGSVTPRHTLVLDVTTSPSPSLSSTSPVAAAAAYR